MKKSIILVAFMSLCWVINSNAQWQFTGFTNVFPTNPTYLGPQSNVDLIFGLDNAEKMRLNTSGQFGIGTNSPTYMLDVSSPTSGDGVNVGGASYYNGYSISNHAELYLYGSYYNIFLGYLAGNSGITGDQNTACGYSAGTNLTYGQSNTLIGAKAGYGLNGGSKNTYVGANTDANKSDYSNSTALGSGTIVTASNQMNISGDGNITSFVVPNTTGEKPKNTTVPVAWEKVIVNGKSYFVALYQ
jgi:hypothetical protein